MTTTTPQKRKPTKAEEVYLAAASRREPAGTAWLDESRFAALERFRDQGLPHRRVEAFKYTDIRALDREGYQPVSEPQNEVSVFATEIEDATIITVLNGSISDDLPQSKGLQFLTFREALLACPERLEEVLAKDPLAPNALADLNMSLADDGLVIIAAAGHEETKPVHIRYINETEEGGAVFVRNVIIAEAGASLKVFETTRQATGSAQSLNVVTDVTVGDGAHLEHTRFDECSDTSMTFMALNAWLGESARIESNALSTGGKAARIETQVRFAGEHGRAALNGVLIGSGKDHIDHTTYVRHDVPHCEADENYRAILTDEAQGVFQGQISVAQYAQKTDSRMMARALLLSDNASMRAKPELEIYADDVKCAHGSTVGSLDEDALFYMMSRGIPEADARALLVDAFASDVVEAIEDEATRKVFAARLTPKLEEVTGGKAG